ncbi:E3 ubiquitin-protein like [Actinidia chinensis var. chinensis]|uniref:E3 ubiquitin-protein ligase RMA n=1 Tax=Actinidia chinensis var. chinensis TaxID=1590841 RepID=A0A2R6PZW8_ACTCC|nr:E3 ubiquitin-protein like [Actinidia chinensis var. chinensis]
MASGIGESTRMTPQSHGNNYAGNFECNICLDLAQDPIVTLCGHLYCWPCLYKWLHIHSHSRECPVCKALVEEEKLVPLYGRGKSSTDPRSKSIPGVIIPNRPSGQRPQTARPPNTNHFARHGVGILRGVRGFVPMAPARFGNFTFSAALGGLVPSLFNLQVHGLPNFAMHGAAAGFPYGFSQPFHGGPANGFPQQTNQGQQADGYLKMMFFVICFFVLAFVLLS